MQSNDSFLTTSSNFKKVIAQNVIDVTLNCLPITDDIESDSTSFEIDETFDSDRQSLVRELKEISLKRKLSEIQNQFIRRKLIAYFKKKKVNRAFIDGAKCDMAEHEARYEDSLHDFIRTSIEEEQIGVVEKSVEQYELEVKTEEENLERCVSDYETALSVVGQTLISAKTGELLSEKFVQNILARQKKARDVLSEQRYDFILTEKQANDTQDVLKELDDLGNGLCMADFEQMRTELQYLTDKIEERHTDLYRLRLKCEADTQKLAHIREKRDVVLLLIKDKKLDNENLMMKQHSIRDELNNFRVKYGKLKKKFDKTNYESGLLNRKTLLFDYDATLEKVKYEVTLLTWLVPCFLLDTPTPSQE